jgi:hypothetical protein
VLWLALSAVVAIALVAWLLVLSGRAPRRRRSLGVDVAPAPMQTPGVLAPGPLTADLDYTPETPDEEAPR